MSRYNDDKVFVNALREYLFENGYEYNDFMRFESAIDGVCVRVHDDPVLWIGTKDGLPYTFNETEHTKKHLLQRNPIAV